MKHKKLSAADLHKDPEGLQIALHYIVFGIGLATLIIFVCIKILSNYTNTWA